MIRRFNRDTGWLATGVLGTVIFAALMVAVQECQRKATEAERDLLLNANPATVAGLPDPKRAAALNVIAIKPSWIERVDKPIPREPSLIANAGSIWWNVVLLTLPTDMASNVLAGGG